MSKEMENVRNQNFNCTDNRLLDLFSLLLTVILSEPHHMWEWQKLNFRRNEHIKNLSEWNHLSDYNPSSYVTFCHFFDVSLEWLHGQTVILQYIHSNPFTIHLNLVSWFWADRGDKYRLYRNKWLWCWRWR